MKILLLPSKTPGYIEWFTYTGLFRLVGNNAVDYPRLDHLWEQPCESPNNYSVQGWLGGEKDDVDRNNIEEKVKEDFFDLILVSIRAWKEYASLLLGKENFCIIDGEDSSALDMSFIEKCKPVIYFKRELPLDFSHANILPLPFSFETPTLKECEKKHKLFGLFNQASSKERERIINALPDYYSDVLCNVPVEKRLLRNEYYREMQASQVALSIRGTGFDTLRFWEALSLGVPLFSQRPDIQIPDMPEEGKEAVYFDDIADLRLKLNYYLNKPEELDSLGRSGRESFMNNHTCEKRAHYLLENYFEKRKAQLLFSQIYQTIPPKDAIFDYDFTKGIIFTDIAEYIEIFKDVESFWTEMAKEKDLSSTLNAEEGDVIDWKTALKGHFFFLKGDFYSAISYYEKCRLNTFTLDLIRGMTSCLLGNEFKTSQHWWRAQKKFNPSLLNAFMKEYIGVDSHPERITLFPVIKGRGIEIGCGGRKTSPDVIGVDLLAKSQKGDVGVVKGQMSVADYKCSGDNLYFFEDESVDYIIQRHNLEHYQDPVLAMSEWLRVLKPGGLLGFIVPNDETVDTIKLDASHKHVFTRKSLRNFVALFPQCEIVHLDVCLEDWSFLAVIQKKGGTLFNYSDALRNIESSLVITSFAEGKLAHKPSQIKMGLQKAFDISVDKEQAAFEVINTLVVRGMSDFAMEFIGKNCFDLKNLCLLKGFVYLSTGKVELAEEILHKYNEDVEESYLYHYLLFSLNLLENNKEKAWDNLFDSLRLNPYQPEGLKQFYELSRELHFIEKALEIFQHFGSLPPRVTVMTNFIHALLLIHIDKLSEAVPLLQQVLIDDPDHQDAQTLLKRCLEQ
ncbi:MAG: glycosyltransferase [Nitrospinae bacterium]|nr:glycosyltransferase [Nitrospinota bacterium]